MKPYLFQMEDQESLQVKSVKGEHKQNVLNILNAFKEYVKNPKARSFSVEDVEGYKNLFILNSGLCGNITSLFTKNTSYTIQLTKIFRDWPLFSGSIQHPIRMDAMIDDSKYEYRKAYASGYGMYDKDSPYCQKRLDLLDFVISKVDEDFDNYVFVH